MMTDAPRRAWLAPLTLLAVFALLAWRFALLRHTDLAVAEWQLLWSFWKTGSFDSSWLGVNYLAYHWRPLIAFFAVLVHFMPDVLQASCGSMVYEWWQAVFYTAAVSSVHYRVRATTGDVLLAAGTALLLAALSLCMPYLYPLLGAALWCARAERPVVFLSVAVLFFADAGDCGTVAGATALCAAGLAAIRGGARPRGRLYLGTGLTALCVWLVLQFVLPEYGFGGHAASRYSTTAVDARTLAWTLVVAALAAGGATVRVVRSRAVTVLVAAAMGAGVAGGERLLSPRGAMADADGNLLSPVQCRFCVRNEPAVPLPESRPGLFAPPSSDLRPVRVRPDGVVIPLRAGMAGSADTVPVMALSIANAAGDSVRLPFSDRRFTETVFVPMELLHEGANPLQFALRVGTECVQQLPLTVPLDLTPPVLTEQDEELAATDAASALRVLAWQPSRAPRPLAVGFHRRQLTSAWVHFWRDEAFSSRRSFSIDPDDLEEGDMLWLEDEAGNAATYAREGGRWKLLGTRNFLHVDQPAGLPAHWDLPIPACF